MEHPPYTAETFTTTHQRLRVKHVVKSYHTRWIMYFRILLCHKRCCQRSPWSERDSWPGRIWGVCWPYCQRTMLSVVCVQQTAPAAKWMKKEPDKKINQTVQRHCSKIKAYHDMIERYAAWGMCFSDYLIFFNNYKKNRVCMRDWLKRPLVLFLNSVSWSNRYESRVLTIRQPRLKNRGVFHTA